MNDDATRLMESEELVAGIVGGVITGRARQNAKEPVYTPAPLTLCSCRRSQSHGNRGTYDEHRR